ncbi:MAG TPA: proton-conducting transporter membrane subunit [Stellaceae bacterium]|nr:proton-conducting transporter membrane subunit [Stellaceae bacterium]
MTALVPLTIAVPLAVAALLIAIAHFIPPRLADAAALLAALASAAICAVLAIHTMQHGALTYWFGGWMPRPGVVLGIGFGIDPASAGFAAFIGLLIAATSVFAWGFFDEVHAHFHVIMLLFLAAMVGFCLTRDLFNLFVWFEVMSVAAYALTAYRLERPSLAGALNFVVVNSIASFMMLGGVALLYARASTLDFEALREAIARAGDDPVTTGAFCLLAAALMVKAAIFPFHFWLSDAHAVAPSPVSVIFSAAMVGVGLFGLAKLTLDVFPNATAPQSFAQGGFAALGGLTAVIGATMCWMQRHLKRMLAFSTISHLGIMLLGLASLSATGFGGMLAYLVGHGLVKGALFMLAGILLATQPGADEITLRGRGRDIFPAGIAMAVGALLLGGLPWGILDAGTQLIGATSSLGVAWIEGTVLFGTAVTGATVLRAALRIFLDLGPTANPEEEQSPTEEEAEVADRPLWLMLAPCVFLLALALIPGEAARRFLTVAVGFYPKLAPGDLAASGAEWLPWLSVFLVVALALSELLRDRFPTRVLVARDALLRPIFFGVRSLHTGLVGDYVVWLMLGIAGFACALAVV